MQTGDDELSARLGAWFPDVAGQHVEAVVQDEWRRLADRPIQDFLPVLVERAAVERLRRGSISPTDLAT